jgi:hypothetical protein
MTLTLTAAFIAFAAIAWLNHRAAFLLFCGLLPAYLIRFTVAGLPTTALEALFAILFIAWLLRRQKRFVDISGWRLLLLAWVVVATVAVFVSPDIRSAAGVWKAYFIEPVLFFIMANDLLRSHEERDRALRVLAATAIIIGLFALVQRFTGWGVPPPFNGVPVPPATEAEFRSTAFYGFPNAVGLFLAPLVPLFLGCLFADRKRPRLAAYWAAAAVLSLAALFLAESEGALIGAAAGIAAAGLLAPKTRKIAAVTLAVAATLALAVPATRHLAVEKMTLEDWSGRVRKEMWHEAWTMLRDRPVLGAGLSGYPIVFKPYHKAGHIEIFQYPHTLILNFWAEIGLAGLIVFILTMTRFFRDALSTKAWTLAGAGVALIVHGLVDVPYFKNDLAILFWLLMAFAASHQAETRKDAGRS